MYAEPSLAIQSALENISDRQSEDKSLESELVVFTKNKNLKEAVEKGMHVHILKDSVENLVTFLF